MAEEVSLSSDTVVSFSKIDVTGEKGGLNNAAASWRGTVDYRTGGDDEQQRINTDGVIVVEDLNLNIPDIVEMLQAHFESAGKSKIVIADHFQAVYEGEIESTRTLLTFGDYFLDSDNMTYKGLADYQGPVEGAAVVQVDGSFTADKTGIGSNAREMSWRQRKTAVDGDFTVELFSTPLFIGTAGLSLEGGLLLLAEETAVSLDSLVIEQVNGDDSGTLSISAVDSGLLTLYPSQFAPLGLNVESVRFRGISSAEMKDFAIGTARMENIALSSAGGQQLDLSGAVLEISDIASSNLEDLEINTVRVEQIALPLAGERHVDLSVAELEISDIVSSTMEDLAIEEVTVQKISLPASEERAFSVALDSLRLSGMISDNLEDYSVDMLEIDQPLLSEGRSGDRLIALEWITAKQIAGRGASEVEINEIESRQADFLVDPLDENAPPLFSLAGIEVSALSWSREQGTHIRSVTGKDLQGEYTKREETGEDPPEGREVEEDQGAAGIPLQIDTVTFTGSNQLVYSDPTKAHPFTAVLTIDSLDIVDINLADIEQVLTYELKGFVDKYSPLTVSGSAAPLAEPRTWEQQLRLRGLSGGESFAIHHRVRRGQIDRRKTGT